MNGLATTATLCFTVAGMPAPQGSKRLLAHGALVESSKRVKPWRVDVRAGAEAAMAGEPGPWIPFDGPVTLRLVFRFARPKHHYRTGRNAHELRDGVSTAPITKNYGDLDKLERAIGDALTSSGVYLDDAQVTTMHAAKVWADAGLPPGVMITITGRRSMT